MYRLHDWQRHPCPCCGLVPVWFGCGTWCLCEPPPPGAILVGPPHECTAARRLHRHAFRRIMAEEDMCGTQFGTVFICSCGQERRLEAAA